MNTGYRQAPWALVERVELGANEVTILLDLSGFLGGEEAVVRQTIPTRIRRRGVEPRSTPKTGQWSTAENRPKGMSPGR